MTSEIFRKTMPNADNFVTKRETLPAGIFKFVFSLSNHKLKSDEEGKHDKWTTPKHIVLTTLAILTDVGLNSTAVVLALSGDLWEAGALKAGHNIGSWILPQPLTNLKNKIIKNQP